MSKRDSDRAFNRLFNSGLADATRTQEPPAQKAQEAEGQADEGLGAGDPVACILQAWRQKDYFGVLQLPSPGVDGLGEPVWACTPLDVDRAYRRVSLSVHPDKNSTPGARQAFEIVKKVKMMLKSEGDLEAILKKAAEVAGRERERREARAGVDERIALNASRASEQKRLRRAQGAQFQDEILRQVRAKQLKGRLKRGRAEASRGEGKWGEDGSQGEESGGSGEEVRVGQARGSAPGLGGGGRGGPPKRRKPRLIF
ncbi:unnamed protein product [Ostreobium quekettii]|uniref:J domain-containing protein n=1 Tax=Ostreobium quekettii TaxID=121088 RepID=A0A8S1IWZ5_9CHLO|nr:unnamed protein product [Ostreobium quekettii]